MTGLKPYLTYGLLRAVKGASRLFWDYDVEWVGDPEPDPWEPVDRMRILAILNHTSLFEPILAGAAPNRLLARIARHGVAPVALKTIRRPLVGTFFRCVAHRVVAVTRERDHTWDTVIRRADDPQSVVAILPEGRMKRRDGFDAHGNPMTVRGGIADLLRTVPRGSMLLVYSGGLHHIHAPGDRFPRLFRTVRMRVEWVEIAAYRAEIEAAAGYGPGEAEAVAFKAGVVRDLTRRRDRHCPDGVPAADDRG